MEEFILQYGYALLFIGIILEGETPLILASVMANQDTLNLFLVVLVGFSSAVFGDQLFFFIARRRGRTWLARWPFLARKFLRLSRIIQRHETLVVVAMRFLFGLRVVMPLIIGMTRIRWKKYFIYNLLGASIWTLTFVAIGLTASKGTSALFGRISGIGSIIFLCVVSIVLTLGAFGLCKKGWHRLQQMIRDKDKNTQDESTMA